MSRTSSIIWFALILIFLLPTAAGRVLLDVAGGLIFILLALPILLTGIGWLGWRFLQSQLIQCEFCGASIMKDSDKCSACGSTLAFQKQSKEASINNSIPASSATIDITAQDPEEEI